ncbi:MAG: hypothetical protein ACREUQ_15530 [Burkholderiales bacterium]
MSLLRFRTGATALDPVFTPDAGHYRRTESRTWSRSTAALPIVSH